MQLIIDFLNHLKQNNNKEWFAENIAIYKQVQTKVIDLTARLIKDISNFDSSIQDIEPKKCLFRINRDIRFSKDKSPYKTNIGIFIAQGGLKGGKAGYYLHISPDENFVAGGIYLPEAPTLYEIRKEIQYKTADFFAIINDPKFKQYYGNSALTKDRLKKAPKNFPADHPAIEWIKNKSFTAVHHFKLDEVLKNDFLDKVITGFQLIYPYNQFLNNAIA